MVSRVLIVQLYGHLRRDASSQYLEIRLGEKKPLIAALNLLPESVRRQILDERGGIRPGFLILVNDVDARTVHGYEVEVSDSDRIVIVPMIHGGGN
ncbi:MAG: MoaD/ThiS family protein [Nitrososphaerota archaeon]